MSGRLSQYLAQVFGIESSRRCADTRKREKTTEIKSPWGALKRYSKAGKVPLKLKMCKISFLYSSVKLFNLVAEVWRCSTKSAKKHLRQSLIKLPGSSLPLKKAQMFSYEFCEVFKNTFLTEYYELLFLKLFSAPVLILIMLGFFEGNFLLGINLTFIFYDELIQI